MSADEGVQFNVANVQQLLEWTMDKYFWKCEGEASEFTEQLEQKSITMHMDCLKDAWSMLPEA